MLSVRIKPNRRQGGASLVELALVLFILVLLLAAVIDFGRAFNSYVVVTNASREGARMASRYSSGLAWIVDAVEREVEGTSVDFEQVIVEIGFDGGTAVIHPDLEDGEYTPVEPGDPITVIVRYQVPTILTNIVGVGSLPLAARTEMVVFHDGPQQ